MSVYTGVLSACPLLGGLSSFKVSFIGGSLYMYVCLS